MVSAAGVSCQFGTCERGVRCRYDCDFNQQLAMGMAPGAGNGGSKPTVFTVETLDELTGRKIACGNHCYGCTAGSGSSCQGQ